MSVSIHTDAIQPATSTISNLRRARSSFSHGFAVYLGSFHYGLAWGSIYFLHATCALFCFGMAVLFRAMQDTYMIYVFSFYNTSLEPRFFPFISIVHYIIGAMHASFVVEPILRVLYKRFFRSRSRTDSVFVSRLASIPRTLRQRLPRRLKHVAWVVYEQIFAHQGLLGIDSRYYDTLLFLREVVECSLQANQAYQMCRHLSRQWLNRLFVGTLIVNCWITLVLHKMVSNKSLLRLLERVCDVLLDFLASIGVPLALVIIYAHQYDPASRDFLPELWGNDLWAVRIQSESSLVFLGSWMDAISRLAFALGLLLSLDDIKVLLRRRRPSLATVQPHQSHDKRETRVSTLRSIKPLHVGHHLLFGLGFVLLGIHLHAEIRAPPKACLLEFRPWFFTKPTCAIVEFSCYTNREFTGKARDFDLVFTNLNPKPLVHITFRHCPEIDIQPSIQQFPNVLTWRTYNSTIRNWKANAALTNTSHPMLWSLVFTRTNFTNGSLPDGLASLDFPRAMVDIVFTTTNLEHLPNDLDKCWPTSLILHLEFGLLKEYPIVFTRIQPLILQLAGNIISEVPREAFEAPGQMLLVLSGNPISTLPPDVVLPSALGVIHLDSTNISVMPTWILEAVASGTVSVVAGRTPFCHDLESEQPTGENSFDDSIDAAVPLGSFSSREVDGSSLIDCTDSGPVTDGSAQASEQRVSEVW